LCVNQSVYKQLLDMFRGHRTHMSSLTQ